jgi:hypothetical protein
MQPWEMRLVSGRRDGNSPPTPQRAERGVENKKHSKSGNTNGSISMRSRSGILACVMLTAAVAGLFLAPDGALGAAANPLYPAGIGFNPAVDYTKPNYANSPNIGSSPNQLSLFGSKACLTFNAK